MRDFTSRQSSENRTVGELGLYPLSRIVFLVFLAVEGVDFETIGSAGFNEDGTFPEDMEIF